jgi:prepilin-type N-terminal cleavage/methylation domain-containing protein
MKVKINTLKGFTLVELLVVIMIIGILTAIAFIGLGNIRAASDRTQSAANLRGAFSMVQLYANQNDNRIIPVGTQNPGFHGDWRQLLVDEGFVEVPANQENAWRDLAMLGHPGLVRRHGEAAGLATFAMNVRMGYRATPSNFHGPTHFYQAEDPARTMLMSSGVYSPNRRPNINYNDVVWPTGSVAAGNASEPDRNGLVMLLFMDGRIQATDFEAIPTSEPHNTLERLFWRGTRTSIHN